jgi:hypothetical protein
MKPKTLRAILNRVQRLEEDARDSERKEFLILCAIFLTLFLNLITTYRLFAQ